MPDTLTSPPLAERFRPVHSRPVERTFVTAVVTELAAVLEPVDRDPFLDDADDVAPAWLTHRSHKEMLPHAPAARAAAPAPA